MSLIDAGVAASLTLKQRREYRAWAFPAALADQTHLPFLSTDSPERWITTAGYHLYEYYGSSSLPDLDIDEIPGDKLGEFQRAIVPPSLISHPFFSFDNAAEWIRLLPLGAFMAYSGSGSAARGRSASSRSSRASSRASVATSPPLTRAASRSSSRQSPSSSPDTRRSSSLDSQRPERPRQPKSSTHSLASSRRPSVSPIRRSPGPSLLHELPTRSGSRSGPRHGRSASRNPPTRPSKGKGKGKAVDPDERGRLNTRTDGRIDITREQSVERIIPVTNVESTWSKSDVAFRINLSGAPHLFEASARAKTPMNLHRIIKKQDQDSWKTGSGGHNVGDATVAGFSDDLSVLLRCKRIPAHCNGIDTCELVPDDFLADCQRLEPDPQATLDLWHLHLAANEREAVSITGLLLRFYTRIIQAKCPKLGCEGAASLVLLANAPNQYGKSYYIGCSDRGNDRPLDHIWIPIPVHLDENALEFVMENDGKLPPGMSEEETSTCCFSAHPKLGLKMCRYAHSVDGAVKLAAMINRPCDAEMIIYVPVGGEDGTPVPEWAQSMAILIIRQFHNHPVHPTSKPSIEDEQKLSSVIDEIGVENLTVRTLLSHPITKAAYGGKRVAKVSPGFANSRRVKDLIRERAAVTYPKGMGWEGVTHYMAEIQPSLSPAEHYIHAAIRRADVSIVVTMHPRLAELFHTVIALCIDYSFKRVEGKTNEWKIAAMIPRYNKRMALATLYSEANTRDAFKCLFTELFDAIKRVTGRELALRPWHPDATCRAVILDGEVAQAQGFGDFLVGYNNPQISGIDSRDPLDLIKYSLKTCQVHFRRNIDERLARTAKTLSSADLTKLKSYPHLKTQPEIAEWHQWCSDHPDPDFQNWYAQKLSNPWYLATMNENTSKMAAADYRLVPDSTNYVESAHAHLNARTNIQLPLLSAIISNKQSDDRDVDEVDQIETGAVIANDNNGLGQRERAMAQRMRSKVKQRALREENVGEYLALEAEEAAGDRAWSMSLDREKLLKEQIASLRRSRADSAKLRIKALQKEVKAGSDARRIWRARKGVIREKMKLLRADELRGVRIPHPAPSDDVDQGAEDVEPTVLSNPDDPLAAFDDPTALGLDPSFFAQPPSDNMDYWSVFGELPDELMGGLLEPPPAQDRLDFQIALNNSIFDALQPMPSDFAPPPAPMQLDQVPMLHMPPNMPAPPPPFQLDQNLDPEFKGHPNTETGVDQMDIEVPPSTSALPPVVPPPPAPGSSATRRASTRRGKKRDREEAGSEDAGQPSRRSARKPVKSSRAEGHSYDDRWQ